MQVRYFYTFVLLILLVMNSACSLTTSPASTAPAITSTPQNLPTPSLPTAQATATPAPTVAALTPAVQGFVLFDGEKGEFQAYQADGNLWFTSLAPGIHYTSPFTTRVVDKAVYYIPDRQKQVYRSSPDGVEKVNIPEKDLAAFAISPDEELVAWSTLGGVDENIILFSRSDFTPDSTQWIVNRDGSGLKQIASGNFVGWIR